MENTEVARILSEIGDILELTGGNQFKVRAYRQASQVIELLPQPISELWRKGTLTELPGVGKGIADKIGELLDHGTCKEHQDLAGQVPPGLLELLKLEGMGPKTVAAVWKQLGVHDLDGLEAACNDGRLRKLPRMGEARVQGIHEAIARHRKRRGRTPIHQALRAAEAILAALRPLPEVLRAEPAGSLRRRAETVGDVDLLVATLDVAPVMRTFRTLPEVADVIGEGLTKCSVRLKSGLQVDLRALPPESFGAALQYFTGSKSHNVALRTLAVRRGIKISEYGVFDREGHRISGEREEHVYVALDLPWIPPELREGAGEIEAAAAGRLPSLVEEKDLLGDLHLHSDWSSDAHSSLAEIAAEGHRLGRRYLAITDHSRSRPLGMDADKLATQAREIDTINRQRQTPPRLLRGVECDILPDGTLDLPSETLGRLEWVVASVHSHFNQSAEEMTERMVRAIRSGCVDVIGHPSGRLLGERDAYAFDLGTVLEAAREAGVALEVNASPGRLDLTDKACRQARDAGVKLVISSDAHLAAHLEGLRYGVWTARRGWLEKDDVLNTRPFEKVRAALGRKPHLGD